MRYIASCSFGKDSLGTILLAQKYGEPLDEAVYCEVMFDQNISGEVPEHRDFIYGKGIPALERMGVKVTVLRSEKTYLDLFTGRITRGSKKGMLRSFPVCGRCAVQRDCKLKPIRRYQKSLPHDTIQYIGIAQDEQERLLRLGRNQVSLLEKYNCTERDARELCEKAGLLSPVYAITDREAAGSAPMPSAGSCAISMTITRSYGPGCWSCRPCQARQQRNSTAPSGFLILTRHFSRRTHSWICSEKPRNRAMRMEDASGSLSKI